MSLVSGQGWHTEGTQSKCISLSREWLGLAAAEGAWRESVGEKENVLVIHCCATNYLQTQWLNSTRNIYYLSQFLWIRNSRTVWLVGSGLRSQALQECVAGATVVSGPDGGWGTPLGQGSLVCVRGGRLVLALRPDLTSSLQGLLHSAAQVS